MERNKKEWENHKEYKTKSGKNALIKHIAGNMCGYVMDIDKEGYEYEYCTLWDLNGKNCDSTDFDLVPEEKGVRVYFYKDMRSSSVVGYYLKVSELPFTRIYLGYKDIMISELKNEE